MCRALRLLCAAPPDRLAALKRAAVAADYELVGGAASEEELLRQVRENVPDVLVVDAAFEGAIAAARELRPRLRVVAVGRTTAAVDATVSRAEEAKAAVLALPRPPRPVR